VKPCENKFSSCNRGARTANIWNESQSLKFQFQLHSLAWGCCSLRYKKYICYDKLQISCFSIRNGIQNFVQVDVSAYFGFNGLKCQTM